MAPSRLSRARRNISEMSEPREQGLQTGAISQATALAADDWQIIKLSGQDYLSVDNISRFYGLPAGIAASGEKVEFEAAKNPLEFVSGSREVMINGARSWLCFPAIEQNGKL